MPETDQQVSVPMWERVAVFGFGIIFIGVLLLLAATIPNPTPAQYTTFRIVLALAAAGVAALIPGFLAVQINSVLRAGGAIAVFIIVFFFSPAAVVTAPVTLIQKPTDPFKIAVVQERGGQPVVNTYTFPISDIEKRSMGSQFIALVAQLPDTNVDLSQATIFRLSDEGIVDASDPNVLNNENNGVIIISNNIVAGYESPHLAFNHIRSQIPNF